MLPNRFVIIWNGKPIGVNPNDGKPFKTMEPSKVKYWITRESAQYYFNKFKSDDYIWFVHEIQFRIMDK